MNSCSNLYLLSSLACQLSASLSNEDIAMLAADKVDISEILSNILLYIGTNMYDL